MRAFAVVSLVVLLLPASADAQRVRRAPRSPARPPGPTALPPGLHQKLHYRSSRLSAEGYPLYNFVHTDRYITQTGASTWAMQGVGTRFDWRFKPAFSATADLTSTMFGGPFFLQTLELGGRFHPERPDHLIQPYVDLRGAWAYTHASFAQPISGSMAFTPGPQYSSGRGSSSGFGAVAGVGMEYRLTRAVALSTGINLSRHLMSSVSVAGRSFGPDWDYRTTTTRFILGLKYTPQHLIQTEPVGPGM